MMPVRIRFSALRQTKGHEYLIRFLLGGTATAIAGWIAKSYGPETGGLFLAFPAIFCASSTLIEKHERQKKRRKGLEGVRRGQQAAALDACGAALGSIGLMAFAALIWWKPDWRYLALAAALAVWAAISLLAWKLRRDL
jgi:Co/Zn/Cd efflux system component